MFGKMRNHLANDVLDNNMLRLLQRYSSTLKDRDSLSSTIELLYQTKILVEIFHNKVSSAAIQSPDDPRIAQLQSVLDFFVKWESQHKNKRFIMTNETRDDIHSSISGFISLVRHITPMGISINPGYLNSDGVENFFCQQRGVCHGNNTNPSLAQYGPAVNAIIIGQPPISRKSNSGGSHGQKFASIPKFNNDTTPKIKRRKLEPKLLRL